MKVRRPRLAAASLGLASLGLASVGLASLVMAPPAMAQADDPKSPDVMAREIEGLRAPDAAWRQIAWRTCLVSALRESREKKKPLLLWVFIDRPVDDARC